MARINVRFALLVACLALFIGWGLVADAKPIEKPDEKEITKEVANNEDDSDDDADDTTRSKVQTHKHDEHDCKREFHVEGACHPFHEQPENENDGMNNYGDEDDDEEGPGCGRCCFRDRRHTVVKGKAVENETESNSTARDDCCCHHCCHHCHHHCHHSHHSHHCHHCHHCHHSHHCHHCHHCCGGNRRQGCGAIHIPAIHHVAPAVHHVAPAVHHVNNVGYNVGGAGTGVIANTGVNNCGHADNVACNNNDGCDSACATTVHNVPLKVKVAIGPATSVNHVNNNGCGGHHGNGNGHAVVSTPLHTNGCTTSYGRSDVSSGLDAETNDSH